MRFFWHFISALLLLLFFNFSGFSQNSQNVLNGRVSDTNGANLAGARVILRNLTNGEQITVQTDDAGTFRFANLANGKYRITVESAGFSSAAREVFLSGGENQTADFILSVGNIVENVTVTATRTQVATTDTAVPVSVITRETIEEKNVNTIGDIFRTLPGTSTVNEGAFQVRPRIRGLESNRILILVDGERLNNARTSTAQSGIEIGLVEIEQIDTLEVVRGSGSVLYGTDALGGTVNIITKDAPRSSDEKFRLGAGFNGYFSSNERGRRGNLTLTGSGRFFSFRAAQSLERYENYFTGDADGLVFRAVDGFPSRREVGNSQSHGSNTQLTTRFFFNENNDLRLNYERRRVSDIGSPLLTLQYGFNAWFPFSNRDKFGGRFETRNVSNVLAKISGTFYWQNQYRAFNNQTIVPPFVNSLSETTTDTTSYGFDMQTNWILGSRNFATAGISFFRDENKDFRLTTNRLTGVQNRTKSVPDADFGSFAGFFQNEFTVTNRLKFVGGIRLERFFSSSKRTDFFSLPTNIRQFQLRDLGVIGIDTGLKVRETAVTGDFGTVFKVNDFISLTGRIGRSFRVANLFERFFTGAGSIGGFLVGNPNLKPESGVNFDAGVKFRTSKFAGSFTYFNNFYRDFLSSQQAFDSRGCPVLLLTPTTVLDANGCQVISGNPTRVQQTVNFGRVRLQGFEADLEAPFRFAGGFITLGGNISYLRGDNLDANEPFNLAPPLKTVLNVRYNDLKNRFYAEWTTRIVNKQDRLSAAFRASNGGAEPGFAVSDIRGGYNFRRENYRLSFNAGVTNLFNRFYSEQFVFAPARGRSFVFGTTLEFNKLFSN